MALNIKKETEKVALVITKSGLKQDQKFNIDMYVDVSGSMSNHFKNGTMENVFQRTIALATKCDPDGKVGMRAFSDRSCDLGEFDVNSFNDVTRLFLGQCHQAVIWSGTDYACAFIPTFQGEFELDDEEIMDRASKAVGGFFSKIANLFKKKEVKPVVEVNKTHLVDNTRYPKLIVFQTDGDNYGDTDEFFNRLSDATDSGDTYVLLLGVGNIRDFGLLEAAAKKFKNVGFIGTDFKKVDDEQFYDMVFNQKFVEFLKNFK